MYKKLHSEIDSETTVIDSRIGAYVGGGGERESAFDVLVRVK